MPEPSSTLEITHFSYRQLEAYVENRLPAEQRAAVSGHLSNCAKCKQEADDLALFRTAIKAPHVKLLTRGRLFGGGMAIVGVTIAFGLVRLWNAPAEIPAEYAALVDRAVSHSFVEVPADILGLSAARSSTRAAEPAPFKLTAPLGTAVVSTKPDFSWEPLAEKAKYTVSIFDQNHDRVDHSGLLTETTWKPTVSLQEGAVYEWQVRAETMSVAVNAPGPQGRRALFRVLPHEAGAPLERVAGKNAANHLLLGVVYAKAGVLDEADRELAASGSQGAPLLAYLRNLRR